MSGECNAAGPVVFTPLAGGREAVMLGQVQVGEIWPIHGDARGSARYTYRLTLPDLSSRWKPAPNVESARRYADREISGWLEAAALRPGGAA